MPRLLYTLLFYLAIPFVLLRLLWRARKAPAYLRRWRERFGWVPPVRADKAIWVHSVSVGETLAAVPLIKALQQRYPNARLIVTTMTPTGSARVKASFGDSVYHVYAPYDVPDAVARFLKRVKPSLLVIMETELWPNLIVGCAKRQVPVILANARLSEKSARGYKKVAGLTRSILTKLSAVAAQHSDDGSRFQALGLPADRLAITGNIKFDLDLDDALREKAAVLRSQWQNSDGADNGRPILLAASTHAGEDEQVLEAYEQIYRHYPQLLLVLVPRHLERFDAVAALCESRGFTVARRSNGETSIVDRQIVLGDTMGELLAFCGASDIVFVGGSLVPVGGHNLIEPAAWSIPVLSGPYLFNFSEASRLLLAAQGMQVCENTAEIAEAVVAMLRDPAKRVAMGEAAKKVADQNRGALARLLAVIDETAVQHQR